MSGHVKCVFVLEVFCLSGVLLTPIKAATGNLKPTGLEMSEERLTATRGGALQTRQDQVNLLYNKFIHYIFPIKTLLVETLHR